MEISRKVSLDAKVRHSPWSLARSASISRQQWCSSPRPGPNTYPKPRRSPSNRNARDSAGHLLIRPQQTDLPRHARQPVDKPRGWIIARHMSIRMWVLLGGQLTRHRLGNWLIPPARV